ncbi:cytochrome b [Pseudomonas viridiflava]|uniref:Cytochrome n=1 Tax=Pseudomonas viridiflava TaxID=33069 RepID=A0A3M5PHU9_PSEVI|nr:cytochrome b [Pseudomonas viridiflava]MBA1228533.1 cytochrome b [Pseudomonas viridiflava]RMT84160.1 Cytochrome [Pseudomonas viridiflava]
MSPIDQPTTDRYPTSLLVLHWVRAVLVIGLLWAGWHMTELEDENASKYELYYPWHKSFGVLVFLVILAQIAMRFRTPRLPEPPVTLARHERFFAKLVQRTMYALLVIVPLMGYSMSSTYTMSDGVFFFGVNLPELLAKNDAWFVVFQSLHKILAYALLGLILLHITGTLKHRLYDKDPRNDVLRRML